MIRQRAFEILTLAVIWLCVWLLLWHGIPGHMERIDERNQQIRHHYMEGKIR